MPILFRLRVIQIYFWSSDRRFNFLLLSTLRHTIRLRGCGLALSSGVLPIIILKALSSLVVLQTFHLKPATLNDRRGGESPVCTVGVGKPTRDW